MKVLPQQLRLYAVTDRTWLNGRRLADVVAQAIDGGATFVQLREKCLDEHDLLAEAEELSALCHFRHVPFVIDDNVEIALAAGADGVHVGQSDMAAKRARALLGPDKILGVSAHNAAEALAAQADGADYLGCGAAFVTGTKLDAHPVTAETMRAVTAAVNIPVVAIGGIDACCSCRAGGWPVWPLSAPFLPRPTPALPAGNCTAWPGSYNMTLQLWGVRYILSLLVRCALGAPPCTADIFT